MEILEEIKGLISSKIGVIKTVFAIIKLETRLAGLSVYPLLLNVCMLFVVLMLLCFSCLLWLGYFIIFMVGNIHIAIGSIIFVNVVLLVGLFKYLMFNLQKMSFEKTRAFISKKESDHDEQEEKNNYKNSNDGKNITISEG